MKHLFWRFCFILFFCFLIAKTPSQIYATEFSTATIRPTRTKISTTPLPILVTASVSDNLVTEDEIELVVSNLWSMSSSLSNYTVSTTSLPSGITAWPGIGAATEKSGQSVTFPSDNLSTGVTYGFYITGGITQNPSSAGNSSSYIWQLKSSQSGSQQSSIDVVVPVVSNDQIVVSGTVAPPVSDFSADLTTSDDTTQLAQDTEITYTITYGSTYDFATPVTLVADWSLGTIAGSGTPTVEMLEYVAGSATTAYGSTAPVVDLNNRTLTWTITSFPGNTTDQTVTFKLKTSDVYTSSSLVSAEVGAQITNPVVTVESTGEVTYSYVAPPIPSPTPTPTPTPTAAAASSSPTATSAPPTSLGFVNYSLVKVRDTSIELLVELTEPATVVARFGSLQENRKSSISSHNLSTTHLLILNNLLPQTIYTLEIEAQSGNNSVISEQLQFSTAVNTTTITPKQLTFSANGAHIFTANEPEQSGVIFPSNSSFEIVLFLENDDGIKNAVLYLEKVDEPLISVVLGKTVYATQLVKTQGNMWSGKITAPVDSGYYKLIVVIETISGGKDTLSLGSFFVSQPIGVFDARSFSPIERARVLVKKYDEDTRLFRMLETTGSLSTNPLVTNHMGVIDAVFPNGKYQIEVHALGYTSQVLEFDTALMREFPQIYLQRELFPFIDSAQYHAETVGIKIQRLREIFQKEANSRASISVLTLLTLFFSTPLTLLGFFARSHFSFRIFINSFKHHNSFITTVTKPTKKNARESAYVLGTVVDAVSSRPLSFAVINMLDTAGVVLNSIHAHKNGSFAIPLDAMQITQIIVIASGFAPKTVDVKEYIISGEHIIVQLEKEKYESTLFSTFLHISKNFLNSALELNILLSLVTAVLFTFLYQKLYAVPFLVVSLFNLVLYIQTQVSTYLHSSYVLPKK